MKVGKWFVVTATVVVMLGVGAGSATADSSLVVSGPAAAQVAAATVRVDCTSDPGALAFALASANDGDTLAIQGACKGSFEVTHSLALAAVVVPRLMGRGRGLYSRSLRAAAFRFGVWRSQAAAVPAPGASATPARSCSRIAA
jgi:hypothetical protein